MKAPAMPVVLAACLMAIIGQVSLAVFESPAADAAKVDSGISSAVDHYVNQQMGELHIPGLALALIIDGNLAYERGYGKADPANRKVIPNTPFILGSTSKQLTAIAVHQLLRSHRMVLDAPVAQYLPWFGSAPDQHAKITIRQLLSHKSGISTWQGLENRLGDGGPDDTLEANARRLSHEVLARAPGSAFEYSNANYDLLGYLVQVVSGEPYTDYMREHVFAPLGMDDTYASKTEAARAGLAAGFYPWFGVSAIATPTPYPRSSVPSSFLISTAHDLATEVLAELGQVPRDQSEIDAALLDATRAPLTRINTYSEYASGWFVHRFWPEMRQSEDPNDPSLPHMYEHDGTASTFRSYIGFVPQRGFGLVMTLNTTDETIPSRWGYLNDGIVRLAVGGQPQVPVISEDLLHHYARLVYVLGLLVQIAVSTWSLFDRRRSPVVVVVAALVNAGALGLALIYAPVSSGVPLPVLLRLSPDLGLMTLLAGAVTLAWLTVQIRLVISRQKRLQLD